jgi:hypothetical protein
VLTAARNALPALIAEVRALRENGAYRHQYPWSEIASGRADLAAEREHADRLAAALQEEHRCWPEDQPCSFCLLLAAHDARRAR